MKRNGSAVVSEIQLRKREGQKMNWKFAVAGVLAILAGARTIAQEAHWQDSPAPNNAVLYTFANISDLSTMPEGPAKETCSQYAASSASTSATKTKPLTQDEEIKLADSVTQELSKELAKNKLPVIVDPQDAPAAGSLVFTGCFVGADPGSATKRLFGMGLGASHLLAHVRVFYVGTSGPVPVDEFDMAVKGSQKLPPLGAGGLAFNAASEKHETLPADAKRLANDILKRLKKDQKNVPSATLNMSSI
jgi:hypothetical protein